MDATPLRDALLALAAVPARIVGTGGTLALAQIAARLHEELGGQPAQAVTPLQFLQAPDLHRAGAMLFSARAKHSDAQMVLQRMGSSGYSPSILVTQRHAADLEEQLRGDTQVVTIPSPDIREGFLATNSVLSMAVALFRAALGSDALTTDIVSGASAYNAVSPRERLLVLFPPSLAPVGTDIETRCSELGLAAVQLSDLRNFAHGRHTGLARLAPSTTVLILSDRGAGPLAKAVASTITESGAEIVRWHAELSWPEAVVSLLAESMHLAGHFGAMQGIDPAKPRVPAFGRRLYHLPLRRMLAAEPTSPVERKLSALGGGGLATSGLRDRCAAAYLDWSSRLADVPIGAVVLDYDGTVCETTKRFDPPSAEMQAALARLLLGGLHIGFASGRGKSLHEGLRAWLPQQLWPRVTVGLYNGAVRMQLSDNLPNLTLPTRLMAEVTDRLDGAPFRDLLDLSSRSGQVTVEAAPGSYFYAGRLALLVAEVLARVPALPVKVVASGHSVDVLAHDTSKVSVVEEIRHQIAGELLAIGDQGDVGGNDFELLASTEWSISVARCSADPTRCWYVDPKGRHGPSALIPLLEAFEVAGGTGRLDISRLSQRSLHA